MALNHRDAPGHVHIDEVCPCTYCDPKALTLQAWSVRMRYLEVQHAASGMGRPNECSVASCESLCRLFALDDCERSAIFQKMTDFRPKYVGMLQG